ncbi:MAG: 1-deoxy-D-xylulose-5-phosphate synthase [Planctomycetota bacterium]
MELRPRPHDDPDRPSLLERIESPRDLDALTPDELTLLSEEIRAFLLESVQRTGGHLGSNLGIVEIAVALHRVFDFRRDRCVWDVSHQAYVHKLLTGRRGRFHTLRQTGGLCGFTHPDESRYDLFHTGHAGTSVSLGLGLAMGTQHEKDRPHVVSVIGDASLGAGVAFEGLNHAGASGARMMVVLNDNEWSISKSVGALAKYLTRIRSARLLQRAQQEIHGILQSIPLIGSAVEDVVDQLREVLRHTIVQGHVFEELGVTYVGPIDGHDVKLLQQTFERVRQLDGVVLVHCLTEKGKGHPDARTHPERVHAAKPQKRAQQKSLAKTNVKPERLTGKIESSPTEALPAEPAPKGEAFTKVFAAHLEALAERDVRVHVLTAGMPSGTGLVDFAERFPSRFHDVGICEQHGIAMAAGMAKAGLRPVAAIYSTFLQRGYDQVFQEVALQNLPVVFAMDRAGLVGQDGPTHHGVFDIAYLRTLPNFVLAQPRDASDLRRLLDLALKHDGPFGVRYPRGAVPLHEFVQVEERREMAIGKAEVLRDGEDITVWALGSSNDEVKLALDLLAQDGHVIGWVDARFAKPVDEELLAQHLRTHTTIVTVEEHQRAGGFGSAVLEAAARVPDARARVRLLGIPDRYVDHMTTREEQLAAAGIDAKAIVSALRPLLRATRVS